MYDDEIRLTATALELVGVESAAFDDSAHVRLLVARVADLLAPAELTALVADEAGDLTIAAANTHRARDLLALESRFGTGPCTTCYRTGKATRGDHLVTESARTTPFGVAAHRLGYQTCSTLPMAHLDETVGAVCVLDPDDGAVDDQQLELVRLLVEAATIGLLHQRALRLSTLTSRQLQTALDSRVVIEQAKGVLATMLGTTPAVAFDVLRGYARRSGEQLARVATKVVHGDLSAKDLTTTARVR